MTDTNADTDEIIAALESEIEIKQEQLSTLSDQLPHKDSGAEELILDAQATGLESEIEKLEEHIESFETDH